MGAYPTAAVLLPDWLRVLWVILLVVSGGTLAWLASRALPPARWWYSTYAVIALGMLLMYALNPMDTPGFSAPALVVFVVALAGAVALVVAVVAARRRPGSSTTAWAIALVDMIALAYIQIPADVRPVIVCVLVACYLAVVAVLRLAVAVRALREAPQRGTVALVDPEPPATGDTAASDPGAVASTGGVAAPARGGVATRHAAGGIALAVLALSMIYMLSV